MTDKIDLARAKREVCAQARQAALNQVQYAEERWWCEAKALPSREAVRRAVAEASKLQRAYEEADALLRRSIAEELARLNVGELSLIGAILRGDSIEEICAAGDAARAQTGDKT